MKDFQAIDANLVYVLGADGQLWREAGSAQARTLVAKDVIAFQYLPAGDTVYVLAADGTLWRKSGNAKPDQVDQAVAASRRWTRRWCSCSAKTAGCGGR